MPKKINVDADWLLDQLGLLRDAERLNEWRSERLDIPLAEEDVREVMEDYDIKDKGDNYALVTDAIALGWEWGTSTRVFDAIEGAVSQMLEDLSGYEYHYTLFMGFATMEDGKEIDVDGTSEGILDVKYHPDESFEIEVSDDFGHVVNDHLRDWVDLAAEDYTEDDLREGLKEAISGHRFRGRKPDMSVEMDFDKKAMAQSLRDFGLIK